MLMRNFKLKDKLYHGSIFNFSSIDLTKGLGFKDFGKGFYLAYNKTQSINLVNRRIKSLKDIDNKNKYNKYLYTFETIPENLAKCNVKIFECADLEWLDFILACRAVNGTPHHYDIVIGPTADDATNVCLNMYMEGSYGKVGSISARRTLLNNLEPENLGIQVFIGTPLGLSILKSVKKEILR